MEPASIRDDSRPEWIIFEEMLSSQTAMGGRRVGSRGGDPDAEHRTPAGRVAGPDLVS